MSKLSDKEREIYSEMFDEMDLDKSGSLTVDEVGTLCERLGFTFDAGQIKELFEQLDSDRSGSVTLDEFLSVMQPIKRKDKRCATIRRMFKKADKNGDGVLTADELHQALTAALVTDGGPGIDKGQVEQLIAQMDVNGDGTLDYEEFLRMLQAVMDSS